MKAESQFVLLVMLGTILFSEDTSELSLSQETICAIRCSDDVQCLKDCIDSLSTSKDLDQAVEADASLVCRDVTSITLAHHRGVFDVDYRTSQDGNWSDAVRNNGTIVSLHNLAPGTRYQFRFSRVIEDGVSEPEITGWFDTMTESYQPLKIRNISVVSCKVLVNDPSYMVAEIRFIPAEDRSCLHDVIFGPPYGNGMLHSDLKKDDPRLFVTGLGFETPYTVTVWARTERAIESEKAMINFTTPKCLDVHNDLTICLPDKVEGLNATTTHKGGNIFDVNVTWHMPKLIPDRYDIRMFPLVLDDQSVIDRVANGTSTESFISDVEIVERFKVQIRAQSLSGQGPTTERILKRPERTIINDEVADSFSPKYLRIGIILMVIGIGIGIGIGIAVYGYFRHQKRRLSQVDEYEMSPKRLMTTRVLGNGAFGIVRLGSLRDDQGNVTKVAVKMLRDDSNENDLRSFLHEIKMMKALDKHPNIVSLLGCCTIGPYPFLVVEYCSRGDLHSFLRKSLVEATSPVDEAKNYTVISQKLPKRKENLKNNCDMPSTSPIDDDYVQVSCSAEDQDTNCDPVVVTVMDMLNFGRQIATGMEFLSSNRIVHRDLATRNVLVCDDRTVKISDFGLSRDIYQENFYKKSGIGRMPLKWMAIEAFTHQIYSTYSDVWSFGVLLWEIATLGGEPYPGIPTIDILKQLQSGYRMDRPTNCSIPLYNVMLSCWQAIPRDRPSFTILRQELDKLISMTTENEYLDLNQVSEGSSNLS